MSNIAIIVATALSFAGLASIIFGLLYGDRSVGGRKAMKQASKWWKKKRSLWESEPIDWLCEKISTRLYIEPSAEKKLANKIARAGLDVSARKYTARTYICVGTAVVLAIFCIMLKFYIGIIVVALLGAYMVLKVRAEIDDIIRKKEQSISNEMPRFVRTICRNLQVDRDIIGVIATYRKIAGPELGTELDTLIAEMTTGNMEIALTHFENRIGSPEAYRLCSALKNVSLGTDQTSALMYLADDMTKYASEAIRRELAKYPGKMRRSMIPATAVTVAMLVYVLMTFLIGNFSNIL